MWALPSRRSRTCCAAACPLCRLNRSRNARLGCDSHGRCVAASPDVAAPEDIRISQSLNEFWFGNNIKCARVSPSSLVSEPRRCCRRCGSTSECAARGAMQQGTWAPPPQVRLPSYPLAVADLSWLAQASVLGSTPWQPPQAQPAYPPGHDGEGVHRRATAGTDSGLEGGMPFSSDTIAKVGALATGTRPVPCLTWLADWTDWPLYIRREDAGRRPHFRAAELRQVPVGCASSRTRTSCPLKLPSRERAALLLYCQHQICAEQAQAAALSLLAQGPLDSVSRAGEQPVPAPLPSCTHPCTCRSLVAPSSSRP
jgi:hypothetical protein